MSTLSLLKASTYSLKYRLVSDGLDVTRTQAQLVADAATVGFSYLRNLLVAQTTDLAWAALDIRKDFALNVALRTVTAGAVLKAIVPGTRLLVVSPCADTGEADIELRFVHSIWQ